MEQNIGFYKFKGNYNTNSREVLHDILKEFGITKRYP
jgi:hypothetical protein